MQNTRIVTLLFTDVEGSTRLLVSLGEAFVGVIERQRAILTAAAAAYGGTGHPTGGDGCHFVFGSAGDAVATAVEAQRALAAEPWPGEAPVRVRMAIHAGEVAGVGDELFGMALHQASRIEGVTHGGQIVVSEAAAGLIEQLPPGISLRDLGVHRLRDIVRPVRLHQAVAEGIPTSFPPLVTATSGAGRLPASTTSFVGRDRELRELGDLLAARRLVTLTGAGGSGKTRLAIEVARRVEGRHPDGVCLVELAGLGTAALVPEAVLGALGMREPPAAMSATDFLRKSLTDRNLLLVLDNCEHVVAGVAALVSELLLACAGLHLLATSREPLRVPGEMERPVSPLDRPDPAAVGSPERLAAYGAVRLLVDRGSDVRPGFRLTDGNAAAVARICAELEGLPLAIELAAARLRTLSPEQVADRLGDQLDFLTYGGRSRPDRQQTMRATLDWSHQLLAIEEQVVFRRLSVFAGGFTPDAAEQVAAGGGVSSAGVLDTLEGLVSKSLVELDHDRAEPRLRMLEPVRQYAAERLGDAGERDDVLRRHLAWVVRLAAEARRGFMGELGLEHVHVADQRRWSARLRDEQDNVRQALEVALAGIDGEAALRIASALGQPWHTMGQPDGRGWVSRALDAATGAPDTLRGRALLAAGMLDGNALDYHRAVAHLREAVELFRRAGHRREEAWALMWLGRAAWWIDVDGRSPAAWFADALQIFREVDEPAGVGWMLAFLAIEAHLEGDLEVATNRAAEALDVGTSCGLLHVTAESRRVLALVASKRGQHAEAEHLLEDAADAYEQVGDRWQLALVLKDRANAALERGNAALALESLREALRLARDIGSGERMSDAIGTAVRALWHCGRAREAAALLGAADAMSQSLPRDAERLQTRLAPVAAAIASAGLDAHRVAGRRLSVERATDLALRAIDEALVATAGEA